MSIINEALKKVEREQEQSFNIAIPAQADKQEVVRIIKQEKENAVNFFARKMIIVWVCGFALLFIIILIVIPTGKKSKVTYSKISNFIGEVQSAAPVAPAAQIVSGTDALTKIIEPLTSHAGFKLSGIMLGEGEPTAIINNKIVKQGDDVAGATVVSIDEKQAKLTYQGQELTLSIK